MMDAWTLLAGPITGPEDFRAAFGVSRETADRLEVYAGLLAKWQKTINLVAPSTLGDVWHRHMADSAQLLALAPEARRWVDLGSGAGFPGLVLAIMLAEHAGGGTAAGAGSGPAAALVSLVESDSRKCAFLAEVVRRTGLGALGIVEILNCRIESAPTRLKVRPIEVITARALAPLDRLLDLSCPLLDAGCVGLFLKGREAEAEIDAARVRWQLDLDTRPSRTDPSGLIVIVRGLAAKTEG